MPTVCVSIQLALVVSFGEPSTTAAQRASPPALAPHSFCWDSCGDSSSQPWLDSVGATPFAGTPAASAVATPLASHAGKSNK